MPLVIASSSFVPLEQIPQVDVSTSLIDVFNQISRQRAGDFILLEGQSPQLYVRAGHLALFMLAQAEHKGWDLVEKEGIPGLIHTPESRLYTLPIFGEPILADADTEIIHFEARGVFSVQHREQRVGWFFADSSWMRPSVQPVPVFYCLNGHQNRDPDRGTCSRCPAPIKTVIV